jgi:hypothetical protein
MSPEQVREFQKRADDYLHRAGEAVEPQEQKLLLALARDCLSFVEAAKDPARGEAYDLFAITLASREGDEEPSQSPVQTNAKTVASV